MANEKRLIDARDLWSDIMMLPHNGDMISSEEVEQAIMDAQTVDAVEVVHGRWEHNEYGLQCNKCACDSLYNGFNHPVKSMFCPNCGAKMDGGKANDER